MGYHQTACVFSAALDAKELGYKTYTSFDVIQGMMAPYPETICGEAEIDRIINRKELTRAEKNSATFWEDRSTGCVSIKYEIGYDRLENLYSSTDTIVVDKYTDLPIF